MTDAVSLLPTPSGAAGGQTSRSGDRIGEPLLGGITKLLPTPSSSDGIGGGPNDPHSRIEKGHQVQLIDLGITEDLWGKYADAIYRWVVLTRPAPPPTEPNAKGTPRLNAAFAEWIMGWPEGWVTGVPDIARKHQLRIIGNGVVPQQAEAALSELVL